MTIAIVSSPDYFDLVELLSPYVTDARDLLRLANSVADKCNEVVAREVDDALDQAESPFRRIMDNQAEELRNLRAEVERLRNAQAVSRDASVEAETRKGLLFALESPQVMRYLEDGHKIYAIKFVRTQCNIGLRAAKNAVEHPDVTAAMEGACWQNCCTSGLTSDNPTSWS